MEEVAVEAEVTMEYREVVLTLWVVYFVVLALLVQVVLVVTDKAMTNLNQTVLVVQLLEQAHRDILYVTPSLVPVVTTPLQLVVMAVTVVLMVTVVAKEVIQALVMVLQVDLLVNIYNYQVLVIH